MRLLLFFTSTLIFVSVSNAQDFPVRLRIFADLAEFPVIADAQIKEISKTVWTAEGKTLIHNGKLLSAKNFIVKKSNDKFDLISVFDFNSYVAGVVSKEMPLSWPLEALKAQAVIARSYALAKIKERPNKAFHLDTNQMDQVFAVTHSEKAKLAVFLTDRVILKDQKNRVLKAFYHADCGGQTIPASKVWKDAVDSGTAKDPWCLARRSNEWDFAIEKNEFFSQVNGAVFLRIADSFKGRIQSVRISSDEDAIIPLQKLRKLFGFAEIRNSPTSIEQSANQIKFRGKGYGHGAGLCQWGAMAQAKMGRSYMQILSHYYPDAQLSENRVRLTKSFMADLVFN